MKAGSLFALLFGLVTLAQASLPGPWVAGKGQYKGDLYEVWVNPQEELGPKWNAEKEEWPMSMPNAISVAREGLNKMMGENERHFGLSEAKLMRFYSSTEAGRPTWYFLIVFESSHESLITRQQRGGYSPVIFPFVVFADGRLTMPEKKKREEPAAIPPRSTP